MLNTRSSDEIRTIISNMTTEEKAALCSGKLVNSMKGVERLGIPEVILNDGPHGLRKQIRNADWSGIARSVPSTCFPAGCTLACSWDGAVFKNVGEALGEECQAENIGIILGPAINIKRSPLGGRNFEYLSEDPFLIAQLTPDYIKGVQSHGVGTSVKHFAVNNQETWRLSVDTQIDMRTLREIYLPGFESSVKEGKPWTVMCAYNKVNGQYSSQHSELLTSILRDEWGFDGFAVSDWGSVVDRVLGIKAGLELEMPPSGKLNDVKIIKALQNGSLQMEELDHAVERLLKIIFLVADNRRADASYDVEEHHQLAGDIARESMVLLKNDNDILPLKKDNNIAVIGAFAQIPRYQGLGSSRVEPNKVDNIYEMMRKKMDSSGAISYAEGYSIEADESDDKLIDEAVALASKADVAVVFAGLTNLYESEGYDRQHLRLPASHIRLIEAVTSVNANTVVVLSNGSPVEMPWINRVAAVFEAYLGGQALGSAIADLLFGDANPCGKLAETFPLKLSHTPAYLNFPGDDGIVRYAEGIFVGYRYYEKKEFEVLFPFGHGLSYTTYEYDKIELDKAQMTDEDTLTVQVWVRNTGKRAGKEIVELYVSQPKSSVMKPVKELKGFQKIHLEPGEVKIVTFILSKRSFAYYDEKLKDWYVESGIYDILAGKSSSDICLTASVSIQSQPMVRKDYDRYTTMRELMRDPTMKEIVEEIRSRLDVPGGMVFRLKARPLFLEGMFGGLALCSVGSFSAGTFSEDDLEAILSRMKAISENMHN